MQWDGEDGREGEREQNIRSPNRKLNRECLNMKYQTEICYLNIVWLFLGKRKEDLKKPSYMDENTGYAALIKNKTNKNLKIQTLK